MNQQGAGPRLGFQIDTSGIQRLTVAAGQAVERVKPLGDAADRASGSLSRAGKSAAEAATATTSAARAVEAMQREVLALGRALAGQNASLEEMARALAKVTNAQGQATVKASAYVAALRDLKAAQAQEQSALAASAKAAEAAAMKMGVLQGVVGGLTAALGFGLVGAASQAATAIARLPAETAAAADRMTLLNAKLTFAFRGQVQTAQTAYNDILTIASRNGVLLQEMGRSYAEIAVSARGTGISQRDVTGTVSAFNNLGQLSGATSTQIAGATYQFQQALSKGRLDFQDYRFILNNMPAFDVALGKGLGLSPNELMAAVSNGEIDAQKMVRGFIEGARLIEQSSGGLPETVERSQNRLRNEWELTLQAMGKAIGSSGLIQTWNNFLADAIRSARGAADNGGFIGFGAIGYLDPAAQQAQQAQAVKERLAAQDNEWSAFLERNAIVAGDARMSNNVGVRRRQLSADILKADNVLAYPAGLTAEQIDDIRRNRAALQGQLSLTMTGFDRFRMDAANEANDMATFGSAGGSLAAQARDLVRQSMAEGAPISFSQAMAAVSQRNIGGQVLALGRSTAGAARRRRFILPTVGQGYDAQQRGEIDAAVDEFASQYGATPGARRLIEAFRANQEAEARLRADMDVANSRSADVIDLDQARRRRAVAGDPRASRRLDQEFQIEAMRRSTPDAAQAEREASMRARFAEEEAASVEEALKADQRRNDLAQKRLGLQGLTVREFQIQLRVLEKIAALEAQGLTVSAEKRKEIEDAARNSDAVDRQAERQQRQMDRLRNIGVRTADAIGDAFDTALEGAFRNGKVSLENLGRIAEGLALDIIKEITRRQIVDPIASQAGNFVSNIFASLFKGGGTKAAYGGAFAGGVTPFGLGGIVSSPTRFAYGGGVGLMGEVESEAVVPLRRGADGRLGVASAGGAGVSVTVVDQRSSAEAEPVDVQSERGPDGRRMIQIMVRDAVRENVSRGSLDAPMRERFGVGRVIKRV